jgi:hypothetical protein
MADESEKSHINTVQKSTNIEVDLITDMLDWIKNSPQSIYLLSKSSITLSTKAFCLSRVEQSTKKSPDPSFK